MFYRGESMKVLSLFSGIGAFEKALDRLGVSYELVGFSEIDKYAEASYCAIHGVDKSLNLGDITKVDGQALPKDIDLITYGFPCQDISLAGKQKGLFNEDGSQTRSGLFFEALRLIEDTQPKVAIAENVKNLTGKSFKAQFEIVLKSLEDAGYNNYWKVLNAKDFGIPQNRERVFIVSIRKDIDNGKFTFPEGFPLVLRLKDVLETEIDEKYYLKDTKDFFIKNSFDMEQKGNGFRFDPHVRNNADVAKTITTRAGARMDDNFVIDIECEQQSFKFDSSNEVAIQMLGLLNIKGNEQVRRVYGVDGFSPTLNTMCGGNRQPKVAINYEETKVWDGFNQRVRADSSVVGTLTQNCGADLKRNGQGIIELKVNVVGNYSPSKHEASRIVDGKGLAPTVKENHGTVTAVVEEPLRIRKLTPRECFRLMDFDDNDFDACASIGISDSQLYKQAGNSIVVACPYYIIKSLFEVGIFEHNPPYDVCINGKHYLTEEEAVEYFSAKEDFSEASDKDKPVEYVFNQNKLIELLLREGIISVKGE